MSNSSVFSILDMPDEVLVKIILHFNAVERLPLGNSCQKFNDLVFGDAELLRSLDFTGSWRLTKKSDLQQYFNNENTHKKIFRINKAVRQLSSLISKAINLVELEILGSWNFKSIEEVSCLLKPLVHLKRLSVYSWPGRDVIPSYGYPNRNLVLEESFSKLTYLSVGIPYIESCIPILQFCQQLEELHMVIVRSAGPNQIPFYQESIKLSSLKLVRVMGMIDFGAMRRHIMCFVTDPAEWTAFHRINVLKKNVIHLERNVEVCAELSQVRKMPPPQKAVYYDRTGPMCEECWLLVFDNLLSKVIRITYEDAPEKFCCLSRTKYTGIRQLQCLLIDDAKKLLKDPLHDISYLCFPHVIEKNCDVHLLASAFPNLTKLVLSWISKRNSPKNTKPIRRRLRRKGSLAFNEDSDARNTDSSFRMLVENTPRLKVLEITSLLGSQTAFLPPSPSARVSISHAVWVGLLSLPRFFRRREQKDEDWDLDALDLISGWKDLTVIRLTGIPITDGKFLIDIGKECEKLKEVTLDSLGPSHRNEILSYESEMLQMLQHCKNLRKLIIKKMKLEHPSEMFHILSSCSKLEHLGLEIRECDSLDMVSSFEKMVRQCQELKSLSIHRHAHCRLRSDLKRIISKLNRSDLEFN